MTQNLIGLYPPIVSDLRVTIDGLKANGYDAVVTPIVNPQCGRSFTDETLRQRHNVFSRSDLILEANDWHQRIIAKVTDTIDCDSPDDTFRRHSERVLQQELLFAEHLSIASVVIRLHSERTVNLARVVSRQIKHAIIMEVPMVDPKEVNLSLRSTAIASSNADKLSRPTDPWNWWNTFRLHADFDNKISVCLELSADVPSPQQLKRWLGEPVASIIIPADLFMRNTHNYPVLSKGHQAVVVAFQQNNVAFLVKCNADDRGLRLYAEYLRHLCARNARVDPLKGYEDLLEIPLQPLYDNLDSYTYEIFEKDPVKYAKYQEAIEKALIDRVPEVEIDTRTVIVMVVGAGRGPLVRAAINAAAQSKRRMKLYVIEKNPNAIITLTALIDEMWFDKDVQLISTDMRDFTPPERADILVSELLGSFGDNELSPECLDGAQKHLKPDGISIPCRSTSYLNPLMSSKIYNMVRVVERSRNPRDRLHHYAEHAETTFVIYMKNVYHIADPQAVFTFVHPNHERPIDNTRFKRLRFVAEQDAVLTGFAGYFDMVLYGDVVLGIHPETHSRGMSSWFSCYFPVSEPIQLRAGQAIEVNFWRCVSTNKVWYEWSLSGPIVTHIHNHNGRHAPIYM